LRLTHLQPRLRILRLQTRQQPRQDVRRQSRDDAELKRAREQLAVAREIDQVVGSDEDLFGTLRHVQAGVGERDVARAPLDQLGAISRSSSRTCIDSAAG